jgi:D-3-phosphoglycerate dehydrogenase
VTACLIVEPIHPAGLALLAKAGIRPVPAGAADMTTVAAEIGTCEAAITRSAGLAAAALEAGGRLLAVGSHGTGVDRVDVAAATRLGIPVVNSPGVNVDSVAELAIGLILSVARRIPAADRAARAGDRRFKFAGGFSELRGKTAGIVGFGAIGRRVAQMLRDGFGMAVLAWSPSVPAAEIAAAGCDAVPDLAALLARADVVSVHTPRVAGRGFLLGAPEIALMKPGALLVVTSRGGIVDEAALAAALAAGRLGGAGLDVLEEEPIAAGHPLLAAAEVVLTPHVGGTTEEAVARTAELIAAQVIDVLSGRRPEHLVNPEVWERRRLPAPPAPVEAGPTPPATSSFQPAG